MNIQEPSANSQTRLESWKEIGAYLQRDATTARRWEKEEGLPVHRHSHKSRSSVYAYPSEIDVWRASRKIVPEPPPPLPLWKTLLAPPRSLAVGVTLALCLVMVGNGIRPQTASAQAQAPTARRVWDGDSYGPVSADGRYLPYAEWVANGVGIHDLLTGTDRVLRTGEVGETIVLSPDNSQIVYTYSSGELKRYVPRLLGLQGSDQKPRNLLRGDPPSYIKPQDWTPDGKEVLVTQQGPGNVWQIAMVSVTDGTERVLKSLKWGNEPGARLSPDGHFIAYNTPPQDQPNSDIFVLATDGSSESAVVEHPANDYGVIWSSDGSKILFLSDRTGGRSLWAAPVKAGKPAGPVELVRGSFDGPLLGMARNGTLYYHGAVASRRNIYRAELGPDGKATKPPVIATDSFINWNWGASISRDGESIVYYSDRPQPTMVVKTLKTGEERVVPAPAMQIRRHPSWFPDGRSVLATARQTERPGDVYYRVDVTTGRAEEILRGTPGRQFVPAPSGNAFFSRGVDSNGNIDGVVHHDLGSGSLTKILASGTDSFSVSPDGKQVAYIQSDWERSKMRWIRIVPATGGEPREVFRSSCGAVCTGDRYNTLAWSPDGKYLLFVLSFFGEGNSTIWRIPVAGGEAERILTMNAEVSLPFMHPDGKSIFFTAGDGGNYEVWALENFLPKAASGR
jgi:Tol biopolymer transport system component